MTFLNNRGKEEELKQLKSELAALDRKITAELAPKHDEKDGEEVKEVKRDEQPQQSQWVENQAQSPGSKESLVAEPVSPAYRQQLREPLSSRIIIGDCGATPPGGCLCRGKAVNR